VSYPHHADVLAFHRAFGHPVSREPITPPSELLAARQAFIAEEHGELHEALLKGDRPGIGDALVDLAYFAHGSLLAFGWRYVPRDRYGTSTLDEVVLKFLACIPRETARAHNALLAITARCRTAAELYRLPFDEMWTAVHAANMAKVWPDGTVHYGEHHKVLKPPGWQAPDIAAIVAAHDLALAEDNAREVTW
jgi:predicted HAD superfamily Cof-like phosphohydrolase